jgi:hypothetical protein
MVSQRRTAVQSKARYGVASWCSATETSPCPPSQFAAYETVRLSAAHDGSWPSYTADTPREAPPAAGMTRMDPVRPADSPGAYGFT